MLSNQKLLETFYDVKEVNKNTKREGLHLYIKSNLGENIF